MNEAALLQLLLIADGGEIDVKEQRREDADYRQRARLIDREEGLCVLLTRCTSAPRGDLCVPRKWYALSVTRFAPNGGRPPAITFDDVDGIGRALFGAAVDGAIATTDTFVPNQVQVNLSCDQDWKPVPWRTDLPRASSWFRWSEREVFAWTAEEA